MTHQANTALNHTDNSEPTIPRIALHYMIIFNIFGSGPSLCVFGIATNVLNIVTFLRQSLGDAVNISLLGLAISDLASLVTAVFTHICIVLEFLAVDLPFAPKGFMYVSAWLHVLLTRVSAWITAYITFERCLCITYPLKVKAIITPTRTVTYILLIYVVMVSSIVPVLCPLRATYVFNPIRNKTVLGITLMVDRNDIETISFVLNGLVPMSSFVAVTACTIILVQNLKSKAKWRRHSTATGQGHNLSSRDTKVIKMVVFISTVFITCSAPGAGIYIWMIIDPELRVDGRHWDLFLVNFTATFHLEYINAGVNIFIYFRMSSKFKGIFLQTFGCSQWLPRTDKKMFST